jgi:peptidoglycan hydrolase-like protein with peptidoglycan-binding domain
MSFKFQDGEADRPSHHFSKVLEFGMQDDDVIALQDILKFEGYFPFNIDSTGYFGAITADALYKWQKKHSVAELSELDGLKGRRVGDKTIQSLNEIYG